MSKIQQSMDDRILQYLDGNMAMHDRSVFENSLKSESDLQERFLQLKLVHDSLHSNRLENPGANFTANVMRNLAQDSIRLNISPKNGLMLLLGVCIALTLGVIFLSSGWFDQLTGVIALNQIRMPEKLIQQPLPSIPFNATLVVKFLIGLNLAIAFVLFDRTVLQPFFRNRAVNQ